MDAGIWIAYPPCHQQLAPRALRLNGSVGAALRMRKQMCVRTPKALTLLSGALLSGFGGQREQEGDACVECAHQLHCYILGDIRAHA